MDKRKRDESDQDGSRKRPSHFLKWPVKLRNRLRPPSSFEYTMMEQQDIPRTTLTDPVPATLLAAPELPSPHAQHRRVTLATNVASPTGSDQNHHYSWSTQQSDPDDVPLARLREQLTMNNVPIAAQGLQQMQDEHEVQQNIEASAPAQSQLMERKRSDKRQGVRGALDMLKNFSLGKRSRDDDDDDDNIASDMPPPRRAKLQKRAKRPLPQELGAPQATAVYQTPPDSIGSSPLQPVPAPPSTFQERPEQTARGERPRHIIATQQNRRMSTFPVQSAPTLNRSGALSRRNQSHPLPPSLSNFNAIPLQDQSNVSSEGQIPAIQVAHAPPSRPDFDFQLGLGTPSISPFPSGWAMNGYNTMAQATNQNTFMPYYASWAPVNQYQQQIQTPLSQPNMLWNPQAQQQDQQQYQTLNQYGVPGSIDPVGWQHQQNLIGNARNGESAWFSRQQAGGRASRTEHRSQQREQMRRHRQQQFQNESNPQEPPATAQYAAVRAGAHMRQNLPTPQNNPSHFGLTGDYDQDQRLRNDPNLSEAFAIRYGQSSWDSTQPQIPSTFGMPNSAIYEGCFQQQQNASSSHMTDSATYETHFPNRHLTMSDIETQRSSSDNGNTIKHDSELPPITEEREPQSDNMAAVPIPRSNVVEDAFEVNHSRERTPASLPVTADWDDSASRPPSSNLDDPLFGGSLLGNLDRPSPQAEHTAEALMALSTTNQSSRPPRQFTPLGFPKVPEESITSSRSSVHNRISGTRFPGFTERSVSPLSRTDGVGRCSPVSEISAREEVLDEMMDDEEPEIHTARPMTMRHLTQPVDLSGWDGLEYGLYRVSLDDSSNVPRSGVGEAGTPRVSKREM